MKAKITTAQAMSHPDVVATINALGQIADELREEVARLTKINSDLCRVHNERINDSVRYEEAVGQLKSESARLREENRAHAEFLDRKYYILAAENKVLRDTLDGLKNRKHPVKLLPRELADPEYMQAYLDAMNDDFEMYLKELTVLREAAQQALDHCESYKFYGEVAGKHKAVCAGLSAALTKEATK